MGKSFMYGPKGEQEMFDSESDAPRGWKDHPFAEPEVEPESEEAAEPGPFDHDGDGKPGGSKPGRKRKA